MTRRKQLNQIKKDGFGWMYGVKYWTVRPFEIELKQLERAKAQVN